MEEEKKIYQKWWFILLIIIVYTIIIVLITASVMNKTSIKTGANEIDDLITEGNHKIEKQKPKAVSLNDKIEEKDWEVTIKETGFKQDIVPSNPDSYYTHYQVKDTNNTYFYLVVEAKNISSLELRADKIAKVKVKYNDKYEYTTFSTIEESGGGTFTYTNITDIAPLTSRKVYYLVELPQTIAQETNTQIKAEININNNLYELIIR